MTPRYTLSRLSLETDFRRWRLVGTVPIVEPNSEIALRFKKECSTRLGISSHGLHVEGARIRPTGTRRLENS